MTVIRFARLPFQERTINLEYQWLNPDRSRAPLLVFLHDGLGSLAMWRDFPQRLCDAGSFRGLVFSRYGYGQSTPRPKEEKWPVSFMHDQARDLLPTFLEKVTNAQNHRPWLFGHSDGGSIALIYAALFPDAVSGIIAVAPHIFVEEVTRESITQAKTRYQTTGFKHGLACYHADPDSAFWGWNDVWLNPAFNQWNIEGLLPSIVCPVLAVQGENDEYGTMAQVNGIHRLVGQSELLKLDSCGHSPHVDQPEVLTQATIAFIHRHSSSTLY
ncbi:alpha/beta fold hydrolase [Chloroflexota bacterium]